MSLFFNPTQFKNVQSLEDAKKMFEGILERLGNKSHRELGLKGDYFDYVPILRHNIEVINTEIEKLNQSTKNGTVVNFHIPSESSIKKKSSHEEELRNHIEDLVKELDHEH